MQDREAGLRRTLTVYKFVAIIQAFTAARCVYNLVRGYNSFGLTLIYLLAIGAAASWTAWRIRIVQTLLSEDK